MKKLLVTLVCASMLFMSSCTRIEPGNTGFKISYSGDYRGTDSLPQEVGYVWFTPGFSTVIEFPTSMQHVVYSEGAGEGKDTGMQIIVGLKGGASFKFDIGLNYTILPNRAAHLYFKFKTDDLESLNNGYMRNTTRKVLNDLAGAWTMEDMLNNRPDFEKSAEKNLGDLLKVDGIILNQLTILKTPVATDPNLELAINAKIKAKQDADRKQTELQSSVADANKKIAEARGDSAQRIINASSIAESNKLMEASLSDGILRKLWIEKWDGSLPTYMLGDKSSTLLQLPTSSK